MSVQHPDDASIRAVYAEYLAGWNARSGARVAAVLTDDGDVVGFDGSATHGRLQIAADMRRLFADHQTPAYVGLVRSVRGIADGVAVLHAVAGMSDPVTDRLDPALHAVHTAVVVQEGRRWKISVLTATPARYHGHPAAVAALTADLEAVR